MNDIIQLDLLTADGNMTSIVLQGSPEGRHVFKSDLEYVGFLHISAVDGEWAVFLDEEGRFPSAEDTKNGYCKISSAELIRIEYCGKIYMIYPDVQTEVGSTFHKYLAVDGGVLVIGRRESAEIRLDSVFVSREHAAIECLPDGSFAIKDLDSRNGTYVNNKRIKSARLRMGDVVYIMGYNIIVGNSFLAICGDALIQTGHLRLIAPNMNNYKERDNVEEPVIEFFNRLPRHKKKFEVEDIDIEMPPMMLGKNGAPVLLRMGSSMLYGSSALMSGNAIGAMTSMVLPLLNTRFTEKERADYEVKRQKVYTEYLENLKKQIKEEIRREQNELNNLNPELRLILGYTDDGKRLWERRVSDNDFLDIRVGHGQRPMEAQLKYQKRKLEMEEDALLDKMYEIAEASYVLSNAPIMLPLVEDYVCGVIGDRNASLALIHRMIMEIVLLHSCDEVRIVLIADEKDLKQFEYVRFLPHVWNNNRNLRFIASSVSDCLQISDYIKNDIGIDDDSISGLEKTLAKKLKRRPYYVVFALDKALYDSIETVKNIIEEDENQGLSLVAVFDNLPKETMRVLTMRGAENNMVSYLNNPERVNEIFALDDYDYKDAMYRMGKIARINIPTGELGQNLPKSYGFMEMCGVGRVEHLNLLQRWRENNPVKSLAAPVGIATDGSLFYLNLHEKAQGPHGLVAGMTGSGKSEFIISYILSMAVNFHPDEVAFILIDYKGGGLAGAFDDPNNGIHLPHLVGTITNLDGGAIQRSLMSIESELKRRQSIFNQARSDLGEGTIDIYKYQRLHREGKVSEPLPHLFIISDEFAELKAQQPEFMEQLISTARIGRSLGVHLILATQKPSGVVNEQIRSNTKFRVCLRVQDKSDSMDMLKRGDAAELKDTGRFYLQVGYNEFFALGQSAWSGAEYQPQDTVVVKRDDSIQYLDNVGQVVHEGKTKVVKESTGTQQLVAIVKFISEIAKREGIENPPLWLPNVPEVLSIEEEENRFIPEVCDEISVQLGIVDDPSKQAQNPYIINLQTSRNVLILGTAGNGKSITIQTMLYKTFMMYSPEDVNAYIIDMSSHILQPFQRAPHCGAYLDGEDERAVDNLITMISEIVAERRKLFTEKMVGSFEAYRRIERIPLILVVIDNFVGLMSMKKGNYYYNNAEMMFKEGLGVGVKFIVSTGNYSDMGSKARGEFETKIVLGAKDRYVYSDILNVKCTFEPKSVPGKGLVVYDERPLEVQCSIYHPELEDQVRMENMGNEMDALKNVYPNQFAEPLPLMSDTIEYKDFLYGIKRNRIPIGYDTLSMQKISLPFKQMYCLSLYFGNPDGYQVGIDNMLCAAAHNNMETWLIRAKGSKYNTEIPFVQDSDIKIFDCNEDSLKVFKDNLLAEIAARKVIRDEFCAKNGIEDKKAESTMKKAYKEISANSRPIMVLIENFKQFNEAMSIDTEIMVNAIFKGGKYYNVYFVAGFGPDDALSLVGHDAIKEFNPDKHIILLGGQFDKNGLEVLPSMYSMYNQVEYKYNKGLFYYGKEWHPILMPYGDISSSRPDDDDLDIFEG